MCRVLQVSKSGFYAWKKRAPSRRSIHHQELTKHIKTAFENSHETYGAIRITYDLRDSGIKTGKNTVALLMRREGLKPQATRRFKATTESKNTTAAPNLLEQDFTAPGPNLIWVSDITAIATREGWLYLCVVLDLYSRAVAGWSMSERIKGDLVVDALQMATARRQPDGPVIVHSDRGSQYGSDVYQEELAENGMICSMSRTGCCYDNAVAESFFHSLKTERVYHENYLNRAQARLSVFHYIEVFYNRCRRHSTLDYVAPLVYEMNKN